MRGLIKFATADLATLLVEVEDYEPGYKRQSSSSATQEPAVSDLRTGLAAINLTTAALVDRLEALPEAVDSAEVEFGIRLNAEAGAVIASKQSESHFQLKLAWKRTHQ
jgi:hypothetical protein